MLSPAALIPKPVAPPESWADDCSRLLVAVRAHHSHSVENTATLSTDEIAIYTIAVQKWQSKRQVPLNLSDKTFSLSATQISDCECLKNFDVEGLRRASNSFHMLRGDVLPGVKLRLVDTNRQLTTVRDNDPGIWIVRGKSVRRAVNDAFATGLFSLSEIAFDKNHQRALVTYAFVCGSLCGSGGTWLFENVTGGWKLTEHFCGGWVS